VSSAEREGSKIVAHLRSGQLIKGYINSPLLPCIEALKQQQPSLPDKLFVSDKDSERTVELHLESLKALFFVKSFSGRKDYDEIKFFKDLPHLEGLWVRVKFHDNEQTEGVIHNSLGLLMDRGFFLKPPDPSSNNEIAYVVKAALVQFGVLGVKPLF
jgi:hypothetical protein